MSRTGRSLDRLRELELAGRVELPIRREAPRDRGLVPNTCGALSTPRSAFARRARSGARSGGGQAPGTAVVRVGADVRPAGRQRERGEHADRACGTEELAVGVDDGA